MATRILTQPEIRRLLPMGVCMDLVQGALAELSRGESQNPLRRGLLLPDGNLIGMMPGRTSEPHTIGLKVVAVMPANHGTPYDSHQGVVMLHDTENGVPIAILDASEVTGIRTAAASGVATRLLAREEAGDLAILGSGVQARTHLEAMGEARTLRRVRVFSLDTASREAFAERESKNCRVEVEAVNSVREAVLGADLICTVTSATEPILSAEWIAPGAHINAAGACMPKSRELDTETVRRARVFVDCRESAMNESGDILIPIREGAFGEDHLVGELGDVLNGTVPGRTSPDEITLFDSLGVAVEDLVSAHYVLARAIEENVGIEVELGGRKDVLD